MIYTYSYEIALADGEIRSDIMQVEGETEEKARKYAEHVLEEQYPGEENNMLLELVLKGE